MTRRRNLNVFDDGCIDMFEYVNDHDVWTYCGDLDILLSQSIDIQCTRRVPGRLAISFWLIWEMVVVAVVDVVFAEFLYDRLIFCFIRYLRYDLKANFHLFVKFSYRSPLPWRTMGKF